jgi:hypothetical protein
MSNTLFNEANNISLPFKMAQFFSRNIRPVHHFDGDRAQVAKNLFACWCIEYLSHILTDLSINLFGALIPVYADINPVVAQLAYLAVVAA